MRKLFSEGYPILQVTVEEKRLMASSVSIYMPPSHHQSLHLHFSQPYELITSCVWREVDAGEESKKATIPL